MTQVTLLGDSVRVPNNLGGTKLISYRDFITQLQTVTQGEESPSFNLKLPPNVVSLNINDTSMDLTMVYPERKATLRYRGRSGGAPRQYPDCAIPNVIISCNLRRIKNEWVLQGHRWFTHPRGGAVIPAGTGFITNTRLTNGNSLLRMPFPNFYDDNKMCDGGNVFATRFTNDLTGLSELYTSTFIGSAFNDDLTINTKTPVRDRSQYFQFLQTQESFPYGIIRGAEGEDLWAAYLNSNSED